MHINVRDILAEELGHSQTFTITDERPEFDQVTLMDSIAGEVKISRLDKGLVINGRISSKIELECHRCLRSFVRPVNVRFEQLFSEKPVDDEMPIDDNGNIDMEPLLQQEILLNLPIKILCRRDCPGVDDAPQDLISDGPDHSLGTNARITKGP
jgi:uncharacterized protein